MLERLQKILSARGIASRRKAEEYIAAGLVKVNGKVVKIGDKADPEIDQIEVSGKILEARRDMLYFVMQKPVGVVTSNVVWEEKKGPKGLRGPRGEDGEEKTVRDLLPRELQGKIYPVGRLDKDSGGLLLFTNDGVLAYRLMHPKFDHEKEYEVETKEQIKDGQLRKLREGLMLDREKTKPAAIVRIGPAQFRIVLTEGRNRQIRRMCQKVGAEVKTLTRVRITSLSDMHLKPGQIRPLTQSERTALLKSVNL